MKAVNLKGTQNGYQLILNSNAGVDEILNGLREMLSRLNVSNPTNKTLYFRVLMGNRLLDSEVIKQIKLIFKPYPEFSISSFNSKVITRAQAHNLREQSNVHIVHRIIRNGQSYRCHGDVLFFGNVHEGGKLFTDGNIYLMGDVEGIVHAGFPDSDDKLVIGDLHRAQQVRIGEQFDVVADQQLSASDRTVAYVNKLHALSYGKVKDLKQISPKFYNQIGGIE